MGTFGIASVDIVDNMALVVEVAFVVDVDDDSFFDNPSLAAVAVVGYNCCCCHRSFSGRTVADADADAVDGDAVDVDVGFEEIAALDQRFHFGLPQPKS